MIEDSAPLKFITQIVGHVLWTQNFYFGKKNLKTKEFFVSSTCLLSNMCWKQSWYCGIRNKCWLHVLFTTVFQQDIHYPRLSNVVSLPLWYKANGRDMDWCRHSKSSQTLTDKLETCLKGYMYNLDTGVPTIEFWADSQMDTQTDRQEQS